MSERVSCNFDSDPLDEIDELILPEDAPEDPRLGKFFNSPTSASAACKRRDDNGMAACGAALLINGRLWIHRRNAARWALSRGR